MTMTMPPLPFPEPPSPRCGHPATVFRDDLCWFCWKDRQRRRQAECPGRGVPRRSSVPCTWSVGVIGKVFGKLVVAAQAASKGYSRMWICTCECGLSVEVSTRALNSGQTAHCGCSPRRRTPDERFWPKVEKTATCWLWRGAVNQGGYGVFRSGEGNKNVLAHRYAYTMEVAAVAEGLDLDHLCRVRNCVNPNHLEPVTRAENLRRGDRPKRKKPLKSACVRGHDFVEGNMVIIKNGWRRCLLCRRKGGGSK